MGKWEHLIKGLYEEAEKDSKKNPLLFTQCVILCAIADEIAEYNRLKRLELLGDTSKAIEEDRA